MGLDSSKFKGVIFGDGESRLVTEQDEQNFKKALREGKVFMPGECAPINKQPHKNKAPMQEQILSEVSEILVDNYGLRYDEITPEATLDENLDLDSLDRVEFLSKIEDKFNIRAQDDDLETMKTVQDVVTYIDDRINAHRPS